MPGYNIQSLFRVLPQHTVALTCAKALELPQNGFLRGNQIWSLAAHPTNPDIIFAGTKPPGVFRSRDGGTHWEKLSIDIAEECVAGEPKVTQILFDPHDHNTVLIGVEIDGVFRSLDGGDTWTRLPPLGEVTFDQDIHSMALSPGPSREIHATTPRGIYTSGVEIDGVFRSHRRG